MSTGYTKDEHRWGCAKSRYYLRLTHKKENGRSHLVTARQSQRQIKWTFHCWRHKEGTCLGIHPREMKIYVHTKTAIVHSSFFYSSQKLETTRISIKRQMQLAVRLYNGILLGRTKDEQLMLPVWMNLKALGSGHKVRSKKKSTYFMIPSIQSSRKGKFQFQKPDEWLPREEGGRGEMNAKRSKEIWGGWWKCSIS